MKSLIKNYSKFSDEVLIVKITENDISAFEELYERYARRLLNYFYRMLGKDYEKSQDFLQDLFLKILQKAEMFNPAERFITWVYTIAHNMCRNEYRRLQVRTNAATNGKIMDTPDSHIEMPHTDRALDTQIIEKAIYEKVSKLNDNHRSTFLLRYQENLSIKDISEILECSEGTTKSRLHYATKELTDKLKGFNPY